MEERRRSRSCRTIYSHTQESEQAQKAFNTKFQVQVQVCKPEQLVKGHFCHSHFLIQHIGKEQLCLPVSSHTSMRERERERERERQRERENYVSSKCFSRAFSILLPSMSFVETVNKLQWTQKTDSFQESGEKGEKVTICWRPDRWSHYRMFSPESRAELSRYMHSCMYFKER